MKIKNSYDFIEFIGTTMEKVRAGKLTPAAGNAVANLSGKILQMIELEMKILNMPKLSERKTLFLKAQEKLEE